MDVWVGEPVMRRPYPNVEVEMRYDPWPRWPGWLAWLPSGRPDPSEVVTGPSGAAVLTVESHAGAKWLEVAGERFAFKPEFLDQGAVFKTPRLYVVTRPAPTQAEP